MHRNNPIIVIEDDPDDQQILREVFVELDIKNEILFFDECDLAYDHLMSIETKPFLIICDINLPKMNGIELKKKIDATDLLRRKTIPFVFLTTSDEQKTVNDAYSNANLQGYFKKGTSINEIKQRVKCILEYWTESLHPFEQ